MTNIIILLEIFQLSMLRFLHFIQNKNNFLSLTIIKHEIFFICIMLILANCFNFLLMVKI